MKLSCPTLVSAMLVAGAVPAFAQTAPPAQQSSRPFEILDNSFLVEEAFNQETGIFQNIFGFARRDDEWELVFTQEWPVGSQRHQFSYTLPVRGLESSRGFGDALINYRLQVQNEAPGRPAFAPRVSLILPSGSPRRGLGAGSAGVQLNLPFSKQTGDVCWHWNGGLTWLPFADAGHRAGDVSLLSPFVAVSAIWRVRPMLHLMLEQVVEFEQAVVGPSETDRNAALTVSPGVRRGWNFRDHQLVVGFALPVTFGGGASAAAFGYLSYELPFRRP